MGIDSLSAFTCQQFTHSKDSLDINVCTGNSDVYIKSRGLVLVEKDGQCESITYSAFSLRTKLCLMRP